MLTITRPTSQAGVKSASHCWCVEQQTATLVYVKRSLDDAAAPLTTSSQHTEMDEQRKERM